MGRYTGPKARVNRRLGFDVFESAGAMRASERKKYAPGMAQRRKKQSVYGLALTEKHAFARGLASVASNFSEEAHHEARHAQLAELIRESVPVPDEDVFFMLFW